MTTVLINVETLDAQIQRAGITLRFDKSVWEVHSDPKNMLFRKSGDIQTTISNLVVLTAQGRPVLHIEGLNPRYVTANDSGDGLLYNAAGLDYAVAWRVFQTSQ